MNVVVLAGGFGRRLGAIGMRTPKCLLEIGGRPILSYIMMRISEIREPLRVYVSVNARFEGAFRQWTRTTRLAEKVTLVVEPVAREQDKLGAVGGLIHVLRRFLVQEDLLVISGDNIFEFDLEAFAQFGRTEQATVIGVYDLASAEKASRMGVVSLASPGSSVVNGFWEKPNTPEGTLVSTGIYYFAAGIVPFLDEYASVGESRDNMGDFLSWLVPRQTILAYRFTGLWVHITTLRDYVLAQQAGDRLRGAGEHGVCSSSEG